MKLITYANINTNNIKSFLLYKGMVNYKFAKWGFEKINIWTVLRQGYLQLG